jgi:hypothetical protein
MKKRSYGIRKESELATARCGKTKINNPAARKQPFAD